MNNATRIHSQANDSDPYAAGRVRLHLLMGFELPSDVEKDAKGQIGRRIAEGRSNPRSDMAELATVKEKLAAEQAAKKRKADEDRAWNQFNSQQYADDHKRK